MLAASAAAVPLLVSACRGIQVLGTPPPPGRDVRALQSAISGERALISSYHSAIAQATAAGSGDRATVASLSRLLAEHHQHLAQLTARLVEPSRSAAPPVKPTPSASAPAGLGAVIASLAAAEQAASARLASQLLAVPPSLAQLMASISASEATHLPVLHSLGKSR